MGVSDKMEVSPQVEILIGTIMIYHWIQGT